MAMSKLVWTVSLHGTTLGAALALHPRTRPAAALLLMLVGFGGVGVQWDRASGCDVRRWRDCANRSNTIGAVSHLPQAAVGLWLWRKSHASGTVNRTLGVSTVGATP